MKYAWIENHRDKYAVSRLCRVLSVSRTGYCQWRVRPPSMRALANKALDAKVQIAHRDSRGSYGRPRITQQLRQRGEHVSAERVRRSLKRQGLRPVYRRAWVGTTDSRRHLPVAPNLLDRRFDGFSLGHRPALARRRLGSPISSSTLTPSVRASSGSAYTRTRHCHKRPPETVLL